MQGAEEKQTKFVDEFLIYPSFKKITEMGLEKQEEFFKKELSALQNYFSDMIILSAHVHRDETFHPKDEEMKALFPEGKSTIEALCIQLMFQLGIRIGEGVALKFSDTEYSKITIQRMEEKVLVFDGENFKSAGVQIVEHLKKENDSEYRFISLTNIAKDIIRKARELNPNGEFSFERNGERLTARAVTYWLSKYCRDAGITYKSPHCTRRTTASRLSTERMPLDKIRDILGQVDEKTTLSYIYNPNTEQENLNIMNEALKKSDKMNKKK